MQLNDNTASSPVRTRRSLISLTPLIDVVFILLVFFMLASSFSTEQVIDILAPAGTESAPADRAGAALVRLSPDGGLDLNGEPLSRADLAQRVAAWSVSERPRQYLLQPDPGVTAQQVVTAMDLLKSSGAEQVSLTRR